MNWNEFAEKAKGWNVKQGEATKGRAKVQITVSSNSLEPTRERINISRSNKDVKFQVQFISNEPVMYLEAQEFAKEWIKLFDEPITFIDGPPPNFKEPTPLEFNPSLRERFHKQKISQTSLAPLWGQHISYFGDYIELNAGPRQNNDSDVKYQQEWVEKNLYCPFCLHTNWNFTYAMSLRKPEQLWYDPENYYYTLLCPKCERAVEVIPRELV